MNDIVIVRDAADIDSIFDSLDVRDSTIRDYKHRIKHFLAFGQEFGVNPDMLLAYKRHLASCDYYGVSTKNKFLVCAKIFLRECYRRGLYPLDLSVNVKSFQQSKKHKVMGLDEHDVSLICRWMNDHPHKVREHAILCLLLFQGFRQGEICNIEISDIDLTNRIVVVLGKGMDDKEAVRLHPHTYRAIAKYLESCPPTQKHLFVSNSRQSADGKLTARGLQHIVKGIFIELGIERKVHGFRHYFTTQLIKEMPGSLLQVAQFTRHKSIETLQVYNDSIIGQEDFAHFERAFSEVSDRLAYESS